jgi:hypothetical protein
MTKFITRVQRNQNGSIASLGGGDWVLTRAQVISAIQTGEKFVIEHPLGHYSDTRVVADGGHEYVAAVADNTKLDNLGSLPEF